jgi:hypothetical protein
MVAVKGTPVMMYLDLWEVIMNKIKFVIEVVDRVIAVARLIRDAAELRKKEIEEESENSKES